MYPKPDNLDSLREYLMDLVSHIYQIPMLYARSGVELGAMLTALHQVFGILDHTNYSRSAENPARLLRAENPDLDERDLMVLVCEYFKEIDRDAGFPCEVWIGPTSVKGRDLTRRDEWLWPLRLNVTDSAP